jgi:hypothetical protein
VKRVKLIDPLPYKLPEEELTEEQADGNKEDVLEKNDEEPVFEIEIGSNKEEPEKTEKSNPDKKKKKDIDDDLVGPQMELEF